MKRSGLPLNDPLRTLGNGLHEVLDAVIEDWPRYGISEHLRLEIAAVFGADRKCSLPSVTEMLAQGIADLEPLAGQRYLSRL